MDLVQKLRARGLLGDAVIHTATGREYLTKEHLREQVRGMWEGPSRRKETQSNGTHAHATARFACLEERREKTDASLVSTNQVGSSLLSAGGRLSLVDAAAGRSLDGDRVDLLKAQLAYNWTTSTSSYPVTPVGDFVEVSKAMRAKYSRFFAGCQ